jgi:hypothetical protein
MFLDHVDDLVGQIREVGAGQRVTFQDDDLLGMIGQYARGQQPGDASAENAGSTEKGPCAVRLDGVAGHSSMSTS